jgi:hypothetical protein
MTPRPLAQWLVTRPQRPLGVLSDIDDTLTREGAIEAVARRALQHLAAAGVPVLAITGRPLGWSEPFVRDGTLPAIVAENGAVAVFREHDRLCIEFAQDEATRQANAARLKQAAAHVQRELPAITFARDSAGRVSDIAIDHSEFAQLDGATVERAVAILRAEGMNVTVSSIHINAWFGAHSKLTGARWIVQRLLGRVLDDELNRWVYVGDSTNDQEMFGHFPFSVGVANLMRFADVLTVWPAYLTQGERGAGFAELAAAVIAARQD